MAEVASQTKPDKGKLSFYMPNQEVLGLDGEPVSSDIMSDHDFDKLAEEREAYNARLHEIDPDYAAWEPIRRVIVRMMVTVPTRTQGGIILESKRMVYVPTQSGHGFLPPEVSPWPYSVEGIVVTQPAEWAERLKTGMRVLVDRGAVMAKSFGKDSPLHMPRGFTLPEHLELEPPTRISDKHFGYLALEPNTEIIARKR